MKSQSVKDPRPLIHLCDRHGYIDELTRYLYSNNMARFIEVYVQVRQASKPARKRLDERSRKGVERAGPRHYGYVHFVSSRSFSLYTGLFSYFSEIESALKSHLAVCLSVCLSTVFSHFCRE